MYIYTNPLQAMLVNLHLVFSDSKNTVMCPVDKKILPNYGRLKDNIIIMAVVIFCNQIAVLFCLNKGFIYIYYSGLIHCSLKN